MLADLKLHSFFLLVIWLNKYELYSVLFFLFQYIKWTDEGCPKFRYGKKVSCISYLVKLLAQYKCLVSRDNKPLNQDRLPEKKKQRKSLELLPISAIHKGTRNPSKPQRYLKLIAALVVEKRWSKDPEVHYISLSIYPSYTALVAELPSQLGL